MSGPREGVDQMGTKRRFGRIWWLAAALVAVGAFTVPGTGTADPSPRHLVFVNAPADTQFGSFITSARFDPAATPVKVAVENSSGSIVPLNTDSITVSAGANNSLLHGTKTRPIVNGVATFDDLSFDQTGTYTLTATGASATSVTSDPFAIVTLGVLCKKGTTTCDGTINGPTTQGVKASSIQDGTTLGMTTLAGSALPTDACGSAFTPLGNGVNVDIRPAPGLIEITLTFSKELVMISPNNGASFYNLCDGTDHVFKTKSGADATLIGGRYYGLLPDCPKKIVAPCIESRNKTKSGQVVLVSATPTGFDPLHWGG